jgi:TorA maturation chaperone TorD
MHFAELLRALAVLSEDAGEEQSRIFASLGIAECADRAAFTRLFVLALYPYASVYLGTEGMLGGAARESIAGFWRALALEPPAEPDHLAALLALYARLREDADAQDDAAARRLLEHAAHALFWEHLASWLPVYVAHVRKHAAQPYRRWAELLDAVLLDAATHGESAACSQHFTNVPELADPRVEGAEAFLASLLAPARSGFIMTRDDLAEAASAMGAGLRQGERRYVIAQMFGHDRDGMLAWLRLRARRAQEEHAALPAAWGPARTFWCDRAAASERLFAAL